MITAEQILQQKERTLISVDRDATLYEAMVVMNRHHIGAILVKQDEEVIGIWTERDLLHNAVLPNFDIKTARIAEFMSTDLKYSNHNDTAYQLEDKFLGLRLRHLLIRRESEWIGLLSAGDVMKAVLNEKRQEIEALNTLASWEYYENWRWQKR